MNLTPDRHSVGVVEPCIAHFNEPLMLSCGRELPAYQLVYETYGQLNAARNNAILVCHALSGNHHAAGYHDPGDKKPGWWDECIGPGKPLDTAASRTFFLATRRTPATCFASGSDCRATC